MSQIVWDDIGDRLYETGVDRGVLYIGYDPGVPWNGLRGVKQKPSGGTLESFFFDGQKYLEMVSGEDFKGTIEAFTYPDEFYIYDGTARITTGFMATEQPRAPFGLSYRTMVGNDTEFEDYGYKIHLIYNALVVPNEKSWTTISKTPSIAVFTWDISAVPVELEGIKPTAHFIIDTTWLSEAAVAELEDILYGTEDTQARLPTPQEIVEIIATHIYLSVVDNGDGTWTATSDNDQAITMLDETTFEIDSPSADYISDDTYTLSSTT